MGSPEDRGYILAASVGCLGGRQLGPAGFESEAMGSRVVVQAVAGFESRRSPLKESCKPSGSATSIVNTAAPGGHTVVTNAERRGGTREPAGPQRRCSHCGPQKPPRSALAGGMTRVLLKG